MSKSESILEGIEEVTEKLGESIKTFGDLAKILFIGVTGSGKSTVFCSCVNKPLTIEKKKNGQLVLEGEGISHSKNSETKIFNSYVSHEHKLIFVDCAGFFATNGTKDEIQNSYGLYYLLTRGNENSKNNLFKIIFVIKNSEFDAARGQSVKEDYERFFKMFGISDVLKDGVGVVITRADRRINYSETIKEFGDGVLKDCPIFLFYEPYEKDLGKQYKFEEKEKFIKFLQTSHIVNPKVNFSLSEEAISNLKSIRLENDDKDLIHLGQILKQMEHELKPQLEYKRNSENSIQFVFLLLQSILKKTFDNVDDLNAILKPSHFTQNLYSENIEIIQKHEKLNNFIAEAVPNINENKSLLNDQIHEWANNQINIAKPNLENIRSNNNYKDLFDVGEIEKIITGQIKSKLNNPTKESLNSIVDFWIKIQKSSITLNDLENILKSPCFEFSLFSTHIQSIKDHEKFDESIKKILGDNQDKQSFEQKIQDLAKSQINLIKTKLEDIRSNNNNNNNNDANAIENLMTDQINSKLNSGNNSLIRSVDDFKNKIDKFTYNKINDLSNILNFPCFNPSSFSKYIQNISNREGLEESISKFIGENAKHKKEFKQKIETIVNSRKRQIEIKQEELKKEQRRREEEERRRREEEERRRREEERRRREEEERRRREEEERRRREEEERRHREEKRRSVLNEIRELDNEISDLNDKKLYLYNDIERARRWQIFGGDSSSERRSKERRYEELCREIESKIRRRNYLYNSLS